MGNSSVQCKCQHSSSSNWYRKQDALPLHLFWRKPLENWEKALFIAQTVGAKGMFKE